MASSLVKKGDYKTIDTNFLLEGHVILNEVASVQEKYQKNDTDVFINELRDSMVGYYLGYNLVNLSKHGFDCKVDSDTNIFLEVKSASFNSGSWAATFNDTTIEKAQLFQSKEVFLALALWKNASNLLFIIYGQNPKLGVFLENKVKQFLKGECGVRSTQTLSITQLIFDFDFDIICIDNNKKEVLQLLVNKSKKFKEISKDKLLTLEEYAKKYNMQSKTLNVLLNPNKY